MALLSAEWWRCCRKSRREATSDCSSCKADRSQRHEKFQSDLEKTTQKTPEQKIRCHTTQSSCALPRQGEKDNIASIDDSKITLTIWEWWRVKIVAGYSETLWRSQQADLISPFTFIRGERDKTEATLQFEYPPEISVIWNEYATGREGRMRIAQVAPLVESVPPKHYGGTERIVAYLTEELVRLGHR